ncbi:Sperm surface protein Sp17 [Dissostichus eleginoides]|uniref:Sperm surface protein Sp17 n=1 Tax=Dissostichus eleginoides TaxID=100907 RepID=A0AAD9CGU2_DISEL|nr:Sperm surface protein Sp17 [Dissostichus eleginoides]
MSVPFSNTHLRVPRGFGTILEGLAREILRDQPEDIPKYAAQYFNTLLTQREDSGIDPAEWAAKLEDRFYNNHAFKATGPSPEKEPSAKMTISKEKSYESQTEDESSHAEEVSNVSTIHPTVSEEVDSSESTEEYEEKLDITEKNVISMAEGLSEEESVNMLPATDLKPDDLSGTEEEKDQTINTFDQVGRAANGKDSISVPDQDNTQSELDPTDLLSLKAISNVCSQELELEKERGDNEQNNSVVDMEIIDPEGDLNTDAEEPVEVFSYSGLADVDVCATELGGTERTMEGATAENDEESSRPQPEENTVQSLLSHSETPEHNQQEEDQVEKTEEEASSSESSSGVIHESLTHIEGVSVSNAITNEDSLVEVNFEDVPEGRQIKEVEEKHPGDSSVDVLQTKFSEMQLEEECKEVTAVETEQNISQTQDHNEPAMTGVVEEIKCEGEEMERQHRESDIMNKKVDTNDSNLNNSDVDGKHEGVKTISSSHQPTIDEENSENEMDRENEDNEKAGGISEGEFHQNEGSEKDENSNDAEDETTHTDGGKKEDRLAEGYGDVEIQETNAGGAENHSSQVTRENISTAGIEAERETLEASTHLPEEKEESRRTPVDSQLQDTVGETEVTSTEKGPDVMGLLEEEVDSEIQGQGDTLCEEGSSSPTPSADLPAAEDEVPLASEKDSSEPEGNSSEKVKFLLNTEYIHE